MKVESPLQNAQIAPVVAKQSYQRESVSTGNEEVKTLKNPLAGKDSTDQISLNITVSRRTLETIEKLGEVSDVLNSMAKSLRQTDQSLKLSQEMIAKMKAELGKIVKNFPPFPTDSIERRDLLMNYSALQKEILKMTVPAPPPPAYDRIQSQWQDLVPAQDGKIATPELTEKSSDVQVRFALDALGAITDRIDGIRSDLGASIP